MNLWTDWLVEQTLRSALFVALIALCAWWMRRGSARTRHRLWLVALASFLVPALGVASWSWTRAPEPVPVDGALSLPVATHSPGTAATSKAAWQEPTEVAHSTAPTELPWLFILWTLGAAAASAVAIRQYWIVRRARKHATSAPRPLSVALARTKRRLGVHRSVSLQVSDDVRSPAVVGCTSPALLIPRSLLDTLSPADWNAVFQHELWHIRRGDLWTQWVASAVRTIFWFDPMAWWTTRQLAREREYAVDEAVISEGGLDRMQYGTSLIRVASAPNRGSVTPALALSPEARTLAGRIQKLPTRRRRGHGVLLGAIAGLLACSALISPALADDDLATAWMRSELQNHDMQLPTVIAKSGIPIQQGGVRAFVLLPAEGDPKIIRCNFESTAPGFESRPAPSIPLELEEPLVWGFDEIVEEEIEPPDEEEWDEAVNEFEVEEVEEIIEDFEIIEDPAGVAIGWFGFDSEPDFTAPWSTLSFFRGESGELEYRWNSAKVAELWDVVLALSQMDEETDARPKQLVLSPGENASFGDMVRALNAVRHAAPWLPIVHVGTMESPRMKAIQAMMQDHSDLGPDFKTVEGGTTYTGDGDVVIVADARASWADYATLLQQLGALRVSRITVAAQCGAHLIKMDQYLPVDVGAAAEVIEEVQEVGDDG